MKKWKCASIIFIVILCQWSFAYSQPYDQYHLKWVQTYNSGFSDHGTSIALDSNNFLFATGITKKESSNYLVIIKYDKHGNEIWLKEYVTVLRHAIIEIDKKDNILVSGAIMNGAYLDGMLIKFDPDGLEVWNTTFDYGGKSNSVKGISVNSMNDIVVAGDYNDSGVQYDNDYYAIKFDENSNIVWQTEYVSYSHDYARAGVVIDLEDNVIQGGMSPYGLHAVKYGPSGQILWSTGYHTGHYGQASGIAVDLSGNVYLNGYYHSDVIDSCGQATHDIRTMKLSPSGDILWVKDIDSGCGDVGTKVAVGPNGNIFVLGTYGNKDSIFIYDPDGNLLHQILDITNGGRPSTKLIVDDFGDFYIGGYITKSDLDFMVIKYSKNTNHPPVLNSIGNKFAREGQSIEFQITATDLDINDILTFSAENLPLGAYFDLNTATFSWTPNYDQAGTYENIKFTVTDNGNPIELDSELISITIEDINPTQLIDDLIIDIKQSGLSKNIINSYMAHLKKVNPFIETGKIEPAINQIFAFMCKVEKDVEKGNLDQAMAADYLLRVSEVAYSLGADPSLKVCK